MNLFNYFGLLHSPFPWINTYKPTSLNLKISVDKERCTYEFYLHDTFYDI